MKFQQYLIVPYIMITRLKFFTIATVILMGSFSYADAADLISSMTGSSTSLISWQADVGLNEGFTNPNGGELGWIRTLGVTNNENSEALFRLYDNTTPLDCQTPIYNLVDDLGVPYVASGADKDDLVEFTIDGFSGTQCSVPSTISNYQVRMIVSPSGQLSGGSVQGGFSWFMAYTGFPTPDDNSTRITDIYPTNNMVVEPDSYVDGVSGATTTVRVEWYINEEDLGFITSLKVNVENLDQNTMYGVDQFSQYTIQDTIVPIAGEGAWEEEIWLPVGNYKVSGSIYTTYLGGFLNNPIGIWGNNIVESQDDSNPLAQYRLYVVGTSTTIGGIRQNVNNQLEDVLSATGTAATLADCNILSGFDFGRCVSFALIPSTEQLRNFANVITSNIMTKFPLGYVWSIVEILKGDVGTSIPSVSAVVPEVLPGGGSELELSLQPGDLDWILNATTSVFANESAPSGASLYSITSFYWNILVYMGVFAYLYTRVMGSHLVGTIGEMMSYSVTSGVDFHDKAAHGRRRKNVRGKTYREYNNKDIERMIEKGKVMRSTDAMRRTRDEIIRKRR